MSIGIILGRAKKRLVASVLACVLVGMPLMTAFAEDDVLPETDAYIETSYTEPTQEQTEVPTQTPTEAPTQAPESEVTVEPTQAPEEEESTAEPTQEPTATPTLEPAQTPTPEPTKAPFAVLSGELDLEGKPMFFSNAVGKPSMSTQPSSSDGASLNVSWGTVAGAAGYALYRSYSLNGEYTLIYDGTAASFVDATCSTTAVVYYRARAYQVIDGSKVYGEMSLAIDGYVLKAPTISSVYSADIASVRVTWGAISGATGYRVYRTIGNGYVAIGDSTTMAAYTDATVADNYQYRYSIRTYKVVNGKTYFSALSVSMPYKHIRVGTPNLTNIKAMDATKIKLTWKAGDNATGYQVLRSTSQYSGYTVIDTITSSATTITYDATAAAAQMSYYKIRSFKEENGTRNFGGYSAPLGTYPLAIPTINRTVFAATGTNGATIGWTAIPNASGYMVYRKAGDAGAYSLIGNTTATSYTNTNLTAGQRYYYYVCPYKTVNGVNYVATNSASHPFVLLNAPTTVTAKISTNGTTVTLSWPAVKGANMYRIMRADNASSTYTYMPTISGTTVTYNVSDLGVTNSFKIIPICIYAGTSYNISVGKASLEKTVALVAAPEFNTCEIYSTASTYMTWGAVKSANGYEVWRANTAGGAATLVKDVVGGQNVSTFDTVGAANTPGRTVHYKMRAYVMIGNVKHYSEFSTEEKVVWPTKPVITGAFSGANGLSIYLGWEAVDNADGYIVYRSKSNENNYTQIADYKGDLYLDSANLVVGSTYFYKVAPYVISSNDTKIPLAESAPISLVAQVRAAITSLQTSHPYGANQDFTVSYTVPKAARLVIKFNDSTETEQNADFIYILDKDDVVVGKYSGREIAGGEVSVNGDTVKIRFTSDGNSDTDYYGYKVDSVAPKAN